MHWRVTWAAVVYTGGRLLYSMTQTRLNVTSYINTWRCHIELDETSRSSDVDHKDIKVMIYTVVSEHVLKTVTSL